MTRKVGDIRSFVFILFIASNSDMMELWTWRSRTTSSNHYSCCGKVNLSWPWSLYLMCVFIFSIATKIFHRNFKCSMISYLPMPLYTNMQMEHQINSPPRSIKTLQTWVPHLFLQTFIIDIECFLMKLSLVAKSQPVTPSSSSQFPKSQYAPKCLFPSTSHLQYYAHQI